MSPHYNQHSIVNAVIWMGIFFTVALLAAKIPALAKYFRVAIFLMAIVGLGWFIFGVVQILGVLRPSV
jgi:hypothetical protein